MLAVLCSVAGALLAGGGVAAAGGDPTAPTLTSVNYSNSGATLNFTAPSQLVGTTITSYDIELSLDGGSTVQYSSSTNSYPNSYGNAGPTSSPYTDPNGTYWCPYGTTCSWQIRAVFDNGEHAVPVVGLGGDDTLRRCADAQQRQLQQLGCAAQLRPSDPDLGADGQLLRHRALSGWGLNRPVLEQYQLVPQLLWQRRTDVEPVHGSERHLLCPYGTTCSWRIRAEIGSGGLQSPWSSWVAMTIFGGAPTLSSVNYSNSGAQLNFAPPTLTSGLTVNSYDIELSLDGGSTVQYSSSTNSYPNSYGNAGPTSSPYTDPNGTYWCPYGTTCSWRIRAEIGSDGLQSPWSTWVPMTIFGGAPTLSSVNYSNSGAQLNFAPPTLASGLTVNSYDIELSLDGGSTVQYSSSTNSYPNSYGNAGPTSSPYTDPNGTYWCTTGVSCSWRIRAEIGSDGLQSPWSSWVMAGLPLQLSAAPSTGAAPLTSSLTLTASDPSGQPLQYSVAFGDGQSTTGTITSPYAPVTITHPFTTPGTTYTVGASVTDTSGVTGSAFTEVTTTGTNPPQANAGESQEAVVGVPATLNGSGSQPAASITSYSWSFGDGATGSGASVQHTYSAPGNYTATLTVANAAHLQSVGPDPGDRRRRPDRDAGPVGHRHRRDESAVRRLPRRTDAERHPLPRHLQRRGRSRHRGPAGRHLHGLRVRARLPARHGVGHSGGRDGGGHDRPRSGVYLPDVVDLDPAHLRPDPCRRAKSQ